MEKINLTRELIVQGYDHGDLARLTRSGDLVHVRRGAYAPPPAADLDARQQHLRLIAATVGQYGPDAVIGYQSAAVIHDFPFWPDDLAKVHLIRARPPGGGRIRHQAHLHPTPLEESDVTMVSGFRVTDPARTVVDVARTATVRRSVSIGDAAMRAGATDLDLIRALGRAKGWPGVRRARRVVAQLDPRSESVGESVSRVVLTHEGAPPTSLQREVYNDDGELVGCTDFCWEDRQTLGEFDGKIKYGRLLRPGQSVSDVLFAEKQREDALRDLGWQVVRWVWDDLAHPRHLLDRLSRAFDRSARYTGPPPR